MSIAKIAFITLVKKECTRFLRIWAQTLVPPLINQTLYFIIFGAFVGSQIADINGVSYMSFLVPGLIMMATIQASFTNVVSSFFGNKFQRSIEELLVSPTPNWVISAGFASGGVARGLLVGFLVFAVSFLFVQPIVEHPLILLFFIIMTAGLFALAGLINGILAKKFDDTAIFSTFILTPLTYFGGVFYSIQNLSPFWQNLSKLNPILYLVDGFRYGFYGQSDLNINLSIFMLILFTILLWLASLYLIRKGIGLRS